MLQSIFHIIFKADLFTTYIAIQFCEVALLFHISASSNHSKSFCIKNLATNNNILDT